MPPMRLGMKNTVRNRLEPLMPLVRKYATVKASTLMNATDTRANSAVYQKAWRKLLSEKAFT